MSAQPRFPSANTSNSLDSHSSVQVASWSGHRWAAPTAGLVHVKRALFGATVLALSACPRAEESSAACETEQIEIRVRGTIELPESMAKSSALDEARLLVSVHESSSVRCSGRYVVEQHPGGDIYSAQLDAFGDFEFDVVSTVFPGEKPSLGLDILIDTNANGSCDEGELMHVGGFDADGKAGPVRFEATCYGRL